MDPQTLWTRRAVAIGVGLLVVVFLAVVINACQDSRRKNALRNYNEQARSIITASDTDVGQSFFDAMAQGASQEASDLQASITSARASADTNLTQARKLSTPGEVTGAQQSLLIALELRRDGLQSIASKVTTALGNEGDIANQAIEGIAGQMQAFLASDVVYSQRVAPLIKEALDDAGIEGQTIATSRSLRDLAWLNPDVVAERLGSAASSGQTGEVAPGLHGHGLESVSVGNVTLQPGVTNRVPASGGVTFNVAVANQGDNNESNVRATVTVRGAGKPITVNKTIPQTTSKQTTRVSIPLGQSPPVGQATTVAVAIAKVPGEEKLDNNRQSYTVLFTR